MKKTLFLILLIAISATTLYAVTINIVIETTMGDIALELYPDVAPLTVTNFIAYANDDFYDGLIFHRVIPEFMIQGGGRDPDLVKMDPTRPPVPNEYNLSNIRGTIAMAKLAPPEEGGPPYGGPDSATTEFFINHDDNSANLDNQNGGFTVFGRVDPNSMDILNAIAAVGTHAEVPPDYNPLVSDPNMYDVPVDDIIINDVKILKNITVVDGKMLLEGDLNGDLEVDLKDVLMVGQGWLREGSAPPQELTADIETLSGEYGGAVDIYEDTAIVGAPGEDDGKGAAYILKYDGIEWVEQARLAPNENAVTGSSFGFSVSIWDDKALIGVPNADTSETQIDAGTIYVFTATDDPNEPWVVLGNMAADDRHAGANFGYSVSVASGMFAVGAPGDNNGDSENGTDSGAVYIYDDRYGQLLAKFSGQPGDELGYSIAVKNKVVVAGAVADDDAADNAGAIHVFREDMFTPGSGYPWHTEAVLSASDAAASDWLGYSVDIDNGTIIAGAGGVDDNGSKSGAVYVFDHLSASETDPNIIWQETAKLTANDGEAFDRFGWSVSIDDEHAIVGAKYNDIGSESNAGAAYLFQRDADTGIWTQEPFGTGSGANDYFGHAVAIDKNNIIIGAYGIDGGAANSGTAEITRFKPDADLNDDRIVNLLDFAIMAMNWLVQ